MIIRQKTKKRIALEASRRTKAVATRARRNVNGIFIETIRETGNMAAACRVAGVSAATMYRRRESNKALAAQWEEALESAVDTLELVARERALNGVKEPVFYKGEIVGEIVKPSDRLMETLLRAHRPDKFNPVQKLEHSGGVEVSIMQFSGGTPMRSTVIGKVSPDSPTVIEGEHEIISKDDDYSDDV